jgi:ubiquinone/menaquinone biosynthesis C-methylase UbiE
MTTNHREKDIERFDQWASNYEHSWLQQAFFDRAHQTTLALAAGIVHQPVSVLDVGCGTGKLLRRAKTTWPQAQLIGIDPAPGMIERAKRLTANATFSTGMAEALPLQDASVDLALSTSSFHHWQDQAAGMREVARVLRPGGYFLLMDVSFPDWLVQAFRLKRFHSPAGLRTLFIQARFHVQTQQTLAWGRWLATVGKKEAPCQQIEDLLIGVSSVFPSTFECAGSGDQRIRCGWMRVKLSCLASNWQAANERLIG